MKNLLEHERAHEQCSFPNQQLVHQYQHQESLQPQTMNAAQTHRAHLDEQKLSTTDATEPAKKQTHDISNK
jgi:hypothetical protein